MKRIITLAIFILSAALVAKAGSPLQVEIRSQYEGSDLHLYLRITNHAKVPVLIPEESWRFYNTIGTNVGWPPYAYSGTGQLILADQPIAEINKSECQYYPSAHSFFIVNPDSTLKLDFVLKNHPFVGAFTATFNIGYKKMRRGAKQGAYHAVQEPAGTYWILSYAGNCGDMVFQKEDKTQSVPKEGALLEEHLGGFKVHSQSIQILNRLSNDYSACIINSPPFLADRKSFRQIYQTPKTGNQWPITR